MARILPGPKTVSQLKNSILHPSTTSNYICQFTRPNSSEFDEHMKNRLGGLYNNSDNQDSQNDSQGQLTDQSVEKLLDKLTKEESETKRRLAPGGNKSKGNKSGKDW